MIYRLICRLSEADKQQHIAVSCVIMLTCLFFMTMTASLVLTFAIGIAKEIWDKKYGSGFCWYDIFANTLGMVSATALYQLIS